MATVNQ